MCARVRLCVCVHVCECECACVWIYMCVCACVLDVCVCGCVRGCAPGSVVVIHGGEAALNKQSRSHEECACVS